MFLINHNKLLEANASLLEQTYTAIAIYLALRNLSSASYLWLPMVLIELTTYTLEKEILDIFLDFSFSFSNLLQSSIS